MGLVWIDFEQCVKDRIAYYEKQYDQAARIYLQLLKAGGGDAEQLDAILLHQQTTADELSRLHRLFSKYSRSACVPTINQKISLFVQARLN
jgi:hypothetical protein